MFKRRLIGVLVLLPLIVMAACDVSDEPSPDQRYPPPPDQAVVLLMNTERLAEANTTAAALGLRDDAIGYIDVGESGANKTLYLRDFGITDPEVRVMIECQGYNINGDLLPGRGVVYGLRQGFNVDGAPMVALDGTPVVRFDFEGGWHELCGIYLVKPGSVEEIELAEAQEALYRTEAVPAPAPASPDDLVAYFDIGESGGAKRIFLRDFDLTDPDVRVTMQCTGININGDVLPGPGVVENIYQGTNTKGLPMVDQDGTPIVRFDFKGGWHEVCALYTLPEEED